MGFSKYSLSAILALLVLADSPDVRLPARLLSERTKLSPRSLLDVMHTLCVADVVACFRGAKGGFQLKKAVSTITLLEVVEAIEGPMERHVDSMQFSLPSSSRRILTSALYDVASDASKRLAAVTLADLRGAKGA